MLTESKSNRDIPAIAATSAITTPRPRLVLRKSKTKLIKVERKSSLDRAEVARMLREICAEKGIEYPNK